MVSGDIASFEVQWHSPTVVGVFAPLLHGFLVEDSSSSRGWLNDAMAFRKGCLPGRKGRGQTRRCSVERRRRSFPATRRVVRLW
jgi:hypothetical protein